MAPLLPQDSSPAHGKEGKGWGFSTMREVTRQPLARLLLANPDVSGVERVVSCPEIPVGMPGSQVVGYLPIPESQYPTFSNISASPNHESWPPWGPRTPYRDLDGYLQTADSP